MHMQMQPYVNRWMPFGSTADERVPRGRRFVVRAWERAVVLRDGVIVETLGAGAHRRWTARIVVHRVDMRPWVLQVPLQEVPTADGVTVKVTVAAQARVVDPVARLTAAVEGIELLYLRVQVALRETIASATLDEVVSGRRTVGARLVEAVGDTADTGITLERVEIKDIVLPSELKRAQAEVLLARAEGAAGLERARGEAAALRTLANAARLATETPALIELRLVQELGRTSGHTVVFGDRERVR